MIARPMRAPTFLRAVTVDHANLLERLLALLRRHAVPFCVIAGQGVNAYVEPLVSLDLDLAIAGADVDRAIALVEPEFEVRRFAHIVNLTSPGSDLRVRVQTDPRYSAFVSRAAERDVLGISMPVASLEDVLQGKIWAAEDDTRPSKRQKDLADIARLLEAFPHLRDRVPAAILARLV
jgi:nucleotidyltransferase AbiEii toxin of type IV toxin-antitoxin system